MTGAALTFSAIAPVVELLANGLRVVVLPLPHLHSASVTALVGVGSRHETPATNGLSHFLEHMLFRGTERHPSAYEISRALEDLGGTLNGATQADLTLYRLALPPESVEKAVGLMGEIFTQPVFDRVDVEKEILQEELLEGLDEDGRAVDIDDISRELVFAPHALGLKVGGDPENLQRFTVADLRAHLSRHYGACNVVLAVAGAVDVERVLGAARAAFGVLRAGEADALIGPGEPKARERLVHVAGEGTQTDVRLCFRTFGEHDPRFAALRVLARVLDDGLSTRVRRRICDESGLAYDAFAAIDAYQDCGIFDLGASVEHRKTPVVLRELLGLLRELRAEPVGAEELDRAKRRYAWDLRASLDDHASLAYFYGTNELFGYRDGLAELARRVEEVDADALVSVAGEVFSPARLFAVTVGRLDRGLRRATREVFEAYR